MTEKDPVEGEIDAAGERGRIAKAISLSSKCTSGEVDNGLGSSSIFRGKKRTFRRINL